MSQEDEEPLEKTEKEQLEENQKSTKPQKPSEQRVTTKRECLTEPETAEYAKSRAGKCPFVLTGRPSP